MFSLIKAMCERGHTDFYGREHEGLHDRIFFFFFVQTAAALQQTTEVTRAGYF